MAYGQLVTLSNGLYFTFTQIIHNAMAAAFIQIVGAAGNLMSHKNVFGLNKLIASDC